MTGLDFGFGPLEAEFWRWVFVMARIGAACLAAPIFGAGTVSPQLRVAIAGAVAALVVNWTGVAAPPNLLSVAGMLATLGEVAVGLALGFVLQLAFAAPVIAAEVIGGGMGMGIAVSVDPNSGAHSPALGQYFTIVLVLIFLSLGGHLQFIALVVRSYTALPPGSVGVAALHPALVAGFAAQMFATAVAIALPVTLVLLLVQALTGVLARAAPALNLFAIGLPAGVVAGAMALILSAPLLTDRLTALSAEAIAEAAQIA